MYVHKLRIEKLFRADQKKGNYKGKGCIKGGSQYQKLNNITLIDMP